METLKKKDEIKTPPNKGVNVNEFVRWFCMKYLPSYIRIWPTRWWIATWSAPYKTSHWKALRITIRFDNYFNGYSTIVIKRGTI